jgi:hypothetical protein
MTRPILVAIPTYRGGGEDMIAQRRGKKRQLYIDHCCKGQDKLQFTELNQLS